MASIYNLPTVDANYSEVKRRNVNKIRLRPLHDTHITPTVLHTNAFMGLSIVRFDAVDVVLDTIHPHRPKLPKTNKSTSVIKRVKFPICEPDD